MTVDTMLARLGYRMDDPDADRYTSAIKLAALNTAQDYAAGVAHPSMLLSLQATSDIVGATGGNNLPADYHRFVYAELYLLDPVRSVVYLASENLGIQDNRYTKGSDSDPACFIWGGKLYLKVTTYTGDYCKVKLYYIKDPTDMTAGGTCQLEPVLHPVILNWAEGYMRQTYKHGDFNEAVAMQEKAEAKIQALNERYRSGELL